MARLTPQQAHEARVSLGLEKQAEPVELERKTPLPEIRQATPVPVTKEITTGELAKAAFLQDNSFVRWLGTDEPEFKIDLDFNATDYLKNNKGRIDALSGVDREELAEALGSATSLDQAEHRLSKIEGDFQRENLLLDAGGKGLAMRLAAALTDPVDWAIAGSTAGLGALYKGGKMGRVLTTALATSAGAAGTEAILASDNAFRDETDVAMAAAAGLALGGGLSYLTKAESDAYHKAANELMDGEIDAAASRIGVGGDSAGAMRRRHQSEEPDAPLKSNDEILAETEAPTFKFKALAYTLGNVQRYMHHSKSPTMRKVASLMTSGGFVKKGQVRALSAEDEVNKLQDRFETNVMRESLSDFKAWAKRNNKGNFRRIFGNDVGEEFYSEVGVAMRGITDGVSPEAISAAGKIRKHMDDIYELAQRAGVKGFEKGGLEDYFPRMISKARFNDWRARVGGDVLRKFYTEAIIKANDDIPEEIAKKIARNYVRVMRTKAAGIETDLLHGVRLDDVEKLKEIFGDTPEMDELLAEIEHLKAKEMGERGQVSFSKKRIRFDETHTDLVETKGGKTVELKFTDLYENDARMVLTRYSRAMHGHIAMANKLGIRSRMEFDEFKGKVAAELEQIGTDANRIDAEITALDDVYNNLLGQPISRYNPNGDLGKLSRTIAGYNYATRGGQFGVNALAEMGNIVGQGGMRAVFRMFTDMPKVMKRAANGELEHPLARFAELTFAPGVQTLTKPAVRGLDELAEDFDGTGVISKWTAKADPYVKSAGRFTSISSGLAGITDMTQRFAAVTWLEKIGRFANGAKISKGQLNRLRGNGIDADMQERIFEMFREAGVYRKGRLIDIDIEKWTDGDALDAFTEAATRETRNAIQMADITTSTRLMQHPLGRLVFQFMRFPMDAVNKQLARQIHYADGETVMAYSASMGIAGLVYMAQTSIEFANDPEERAKRLDPKNIARVAYMRTGFSSMTPGVIDTLRAAGGLDPWFAMGRTSGLGTVIPVNGNATMQAGKNFDRGVLGALRAGIHDDIQYNQTDFRSLAQLMPGYRMLGVKNVVHALEQKFPESRKQ